ncbi:hypothetical protein P3S68_021918 [Capsicum galapagoense]
MDNIIVTGMEDKEKGSEDKKKLHGRKTRAATSYNKKKVKRVAVFMLLISNKNGSIEDSTLIEKARADKELPELVPLVTERWNVLGSKSKCEWKMEGTK